MKRILTIVAALAVSISAVADEGMWLLPLLKQLNGKDLREAGCKLTPEQIYSINKTSLKDAIVQTATGPSPWTRKSPARALPSLSS